MFALERKFFLILMMKVKIVGHIPHEKLSLSASILRNLTVKRMVYFAFHVERSSLTMILQVLH